MWKAASVVRVETQRPTDELVHRSIGDGLETKLLALRQELLGGPVLQRVIEEMNLYSEIVSKKGMEAAIERMRTDRREGRRRRPSS